ncbi:MAG: dihydrolipoyl dehydrogenase [Spirochaetales bacterium]|nr:dihydrolipoyl dehydrogenase [Spirochaetales bacterium]
MSNSSATQLAVIGAGPGGYAAAFQAADMGLAVTLIDPALNPGGVCLYRGCIPTKALLHSAMVIREAEAAKEFGVSFGAPGIDLDKLRGWKNDVVNDLTNGVGQLMKMRKVNFIQGTAHFVDNKTLLIKKENETTKTLAFEHAVIATGTRPRPIPGLPFSKRVMDSTQALELSDIPGKLLVVGAGFIGMEMATIYSRLGSKVTVAEMLPAILPQADRDIVRVFSKAIEGLLENILLNTKVEAEEKKDHVQVKLTDMNNPDHPVIESKFDRIIVSIGRIPNTAELGLEKTKVVMDKQGFIETDSQKRTAEPAIFAIGDCVGGVLLAHKASHEGKVAAEVIAGKKVFFEPAVIPAVEYTDPEIAWCGLTEELAKKQNKPVTVTRFPWAASGRALTHSRKDGITKLVIDPETERILGAEIVGINAGELISEMALAIEMSATARDVALTIHPHPTLSETFMEAAEIFYGTATHVFKPKRE